MKIPEGWKYFGKVQGGDAYKRFDGMAVVYSIDPIDDGTREHHFSISYRGNSPTDRHVKQVVSDWGLEGYERDDQGGNLAHLWKNILGDN